LVFLILAPSTAQSGIGSAIPGGGIDLGATLFRPHIWINDQMPLNGVTHHLFTIPKNEYVGLYAGYVRSGTLAFRSSLSLGRQDLRLYSDGPVTSRGPFTLKTFWAYSDLGVAWNLRWGRLEAAPSVGWGVATSIVDVSHPLVSGGTRTTLATAMAHLELPLHLRLREHVALSLAYRRLLPLTDMTYDFGFESVKLKVHMETPYEVRLGILRYH
jgi:hypothetical protein